MSGALARCHLSSCYNPNLPRVSTSLALARCHLSSCYNLNRAPSNVGSALARCHLSSCYNPRVLRLGKAAALARCHLSSCYNIHPRKSPLNRGLTVFKLRKRSINTHLCVTSARFSEKGKEKEITRKVRGHPAGYTPRVTRRGRALLPKRYSLPSIKLLRKHRVTLPLFMIPDRLRETTDGPPVRISTDWGPL